MATSSLSNTNDPHLILSPRFRNRLSFQSIEAESIVKNVSTNRQSTYGINWALKQYEDENGVRTQILLSPRISNHLAELDKQIEAGVSRARIAKIVSDKKLNERIQSKPCDGICGMDLDQWSEQWPDEWRQGQGQGPVPEAIASLPASMQLLDDIERWLLEQEQGSDYQNVGQDQIAKPAQQSIDKHSSELDTTSQSVNLIEANIGEIRHWQDDETQTDTNQSDHHHHQHSHQRHRQLGDRLPGYRHRLLTSPLLYTPAGFGPYAAQTITLPKPRSKSQRRLEPARPKRSAQEHNDYVVINNHHQKRRRVRCKKRHTAEAEDAVTELNIGLHNQWSTPSLMRSGTGSRTSLMSFRRSSIGSQCSERRPKAQIRHGRLEFVIPDNLDVGSSQHEPQEARARLTALQRYRLKQQHRKKLRDDSEKFVDELEKQLDKSEIRARFLNVVAEPKFRHRFMEHPQSTVMKSLNGEAQRFLYSESKLKRRLLQIDQRQPRRDIQNALQRIEQVRSRQQQHREMLEQQYLLSLQQFNVEEALIATRQRLQQYKRETLRIQPNVDKVSDGISERRREK